MEIVQAVGGLIAALAALIGAIVVTLRMANKRTDELIQELRKDITTEQSEHRKTRQLLEAETEARQKLALEIQTQRDEITVLTRTTDDLLTWKEKAQETLNEKDRRIERLERDNIQLRDDGVKLSVERDRLRTEVKTHQSMWAIVGEHLQHQFDKEGADNVGVSKESTNG